MDKQDTNPTLEENEIPPSEPKAYNYQKIGFVALIALLCSVAVHFGLQQSKQRAASLHASKVTLSSFAVIEPNMKYGFLLDSFQVEEKTILPNEFISDILTSYKVDYMDIEHMVTSFKDVFDVRLLRAGKPYTILRKDTTAAADYFVYEPSVYSYIVFDFNTKTVKKVERPIETRIEKASGLIETSLWNTMVDNGLSFELTSKMEDALAWSVDFHYIQKGDRFKLIYERNYIEGEPVGVGEIKGAYYKNYDNEYYAFFYENDRHSGFYDYEARPMKKAFLKSPVQYSRISSGFNMRRFHPVLKRRKPHLGTDYAAPRGTPIRAVADGVIIKKGYTGGNGNYVKIKHDKVYQTQYLHMNAFAKGMAPGVHVKQGQTIGYVGSTGLATGPHVCFRFWKNGRQVNHLRENLPPPEPMPNEDIPKFNEIRDILKVELDSIEFKKLNRVVEEQSEPDSLITTNP